MGDGGHRCTVQGSPVPRITPAGPLTAFLPSDLLGKEHMLFPNLESIEASWLHFKCNYYKPFRECTSKMKSLCQNFHQCTMLCWDRLTNILTRSTQWILGVPSSEESVPGLPSLGSSRRTQVYPGSPKDSSPGLGRNPQISLEPRHARFQNSQLLLS